MSSGQPKVTYLKDYTPPDFLIEQTFLHFELLPEATEVRAVLKIQRNPLSKHKDAPLTLDKGEMTVKAVDINGKLLTKDQYQVTDDHLTIPKVPDTFSLETVVEIKPHENTRLSGLYQTRGNYCTQCESQGFRRITAFIDRPDVMSRYTTTISADKTRYPVLLSNGNLKDQKELASNRSWVKWEDPTLKPAYLFALVGGNYEYISDKFVTQSGRTVDLRVYVEQGKLDQASYAMGALKRAMRWDEEAFGREYELDLYILVAVSDFNFGAMENKGLNIFNDKYILAKPETATDDDYINIESVIGHEYFHNWSGNRVTVRDWFQITLKEGLTIFRDQSFTADLHSAEVKRINDVNVIRTAQFAQDAGPMAHPIRPESYIEITNFYTVTVYNKGAEVIRMIQTMLGKAKFRQAMDLYFSRHDGQAVTTEEFVKAMEDGGKIDLKQFRRWYDQAGTPVLDVTSDYDTAKKIYTLTVSQSCPPTPGQSKKENFHIPLAVGLLDKAGKDMAAKILHVTEKKQTFTFENIAEKPVPSLLRNFSAPVKVNYPYTDAELLFLLAHDGDGFNRWDAGQRMAVKIILQLLDKYQKKESLSVPADFVGAMKAVLLDQKLNMSFIAQVLTLPRIPYLMELTEEVDIEALYRVREFVRTELAKQLRDSFLAVYQRLSKPKPYQLDGQSMGERALKNLCLGYLLQLDEPELRQLSLKQFQQADNMTDAVGTLGALINVDSAERTQTLAQFYEKWQGEDLVIDKWFALQAMSSLPTTLATVKKLLQHPAYSNKNPNKVRALVGSFCHFSYLNFHNINGEGYAFLTEQVLLMDPINAQVAARILEPFTHWKKLDKKRQQLILAELKKISQAPKLSKDVYEIVSKSLA